MIPSGWSALPPSSDLGSWPPPSDASGPSKASSAVAFEFDPASLVVPDASSPAVVSAAALKKSRYLYCCSPQVVFFSAPGCATVGPGGGGGWGS